MLNVPKTLEEARKCTYHLWGNVQSYQEGFCAYQTQNLSQCSRIARNLFCKQHARMIIKGAAYRVIKKTQ